MENDNILNVLKKNNNLETFLAIVQEEYKNFHYGTGKDFVTYDDMWQLFQNRKKILYDRFGILTKIEEKPTVPQYKQYIVRLVEHMKNAQIGKFSDEELCHNRITRHIELNGRVYPPATKITKLLSKLAANDYSLLKIIGQYNKHINSNQDIYLSPSPIAIAAASVHGDSCYSPDGSYEHMPFVLSALSPIMVAFAADLSWRAWVIIDYNHDEYSILPGYPNDNLYYTLTVEQYLEKLGYSKSDYAYTLDEPVTHLDITDHSAPRIEIDDGTPFCVWSGYKYHNNTMTDLFECEECGKNFLVYETNDEAFKYCMCDECYDNARIECDIYGYIHPTEAPDYDPDAPVDFNGRQCRHECYECPFKDDEEFLF